MAFVRNNRRTSSSRRSSNDQVFNEITQLAYQYYVDRGYQNGSDTDDWLRAERVIKAKYNMD